jgi:hypothetical protein
MEPASIRTMNPGAMWGRVGHKPTAFFETAAGPHGVETNAPIPLKWGSTQTIYLSDGLGQDNNIAIFPAWVNGICAQLDLWRTSDKYRNKRFADAIAIWSGGNEVQSYIEFCKKRVPGLDELTVMNDAFWQSPSGVAFLKAQAWHEAGKQYPAPDADWLEAQRRVMDGAPAAVAAPPLMAPAKVPGAILRYVQDHGAISYGMFHSDIVGQVQAALLRDGRELVPDRDYGRITRTAVTKFQTDHQLNPVGYIGFKTAAALDAVPLQDNKSIIAPAPSVLHVAPWLSQMRALNGTHRSPDHLNPVILSWPKEIADKYPDLGPDVLWYNSDLIAWCGLGAGICAVRGGEKPPKGLLGAGNWANFGQPMKLADRTPGSIFVYERVGGHHVTMYESEDSVYYYCRGANQASSICVTSIPKSRQVLAVRWGIHTPISTAGPKIGATANSVVASSES